jgi:hypothetical protein
MHADTETHTHTEQSRAERAALCALFEAGLRKISLAHRLTFPWWVVPHATCVDESTSASSVHGGGDDTHTTQNNTHTHTAHHTTSTGAARRPWRTMSRAHAQTAGVAAACPSLSGEFFRGKHIGAVTVVSGLEAQRLSSTRSPVV